MSHSSDDRLRNPFVQYALLLAMSFVHVHVPLEHFRGVLAKGIYLQVFGNHKFYAGDAGSSKTGLGSSAACTTAVVAAIMQYFGIDVEQPQFRSVAHNIAQAAHATAQNKIGSGFDVAAAAYGSGIYVRFSPSAQLNELMTAVCGMCDMYVTLVDCW